MSVTYVKGAKPGQTVGCFFCHSVLRGFFSGCILFAVEG